jgi:hypothetical protein
MEASSNCSCSKKKKKGNSASVSNYRPISFVNNCSRLFEFVIHGHVSHCLEFKISPCQHSFSTAASKSTITNLVTYVDFISSLVGSQTSCCHLFLFKQ